MNNLSFIFICGLLLSVVLALPASTGKGLHVVGNKLYDGNGEEFIFRGVNVHQNWSPDKTESSIKDIAALGGNSARFVLGGFKSWYMETPEDVEKMINLCEEYGLVCVFENHDYTGSNETTDITEASIQYWSPFKDLFNAHKDYVILNIANEWMGEHNGEVWAETYATAIKSLRELGFECNIMVDAPGWGQGASPMASNAQKVLAADPLSNVIFSVHVYGYVGKDVETLSGIFKELENSGVCWYIGEFGWRQDGLTVAYKYLMKYTGLNNIGWQAWSWSGNSLPYLDLVDAATYAKEDITDFGKFVFYSKYGIQNTSKLAYGKINENVIYNTNPADATVEIVDEVSKDFVSNYDITMEEYEDDVVNDSELENDQDVNAEIETDIDSSLEE
ncbi:glycoside hydrolase family 5 protein [Piromyces sp. E2]|nr:glycoside hydrolase family 5 protein [Piromyces sp. E2]|eukprot:OUM58166.1 glycoside hydrolase family 5 protein [Piromyces sp. E2]